MRTVDALALDFDRTLTDLDLVVRPPTLDALRRARDRGLKVVVVSGRDRDVLLDRLGDAVDLVVAENGAFLVDPETLHETSLFDSWPGRTALDALGFDLDHGRASASADAAHAEALGRALRAAAFDCRLERNRDRVMLLPRGVEKAVGFLAALDRLGVPAARAAAMGDGENDVSLLAAAGRRVAVANAVPELKALADEVTRGVGGEGVREWILERWLPTRPPPAGAPRG